MTSYEQALDLGVRFVSKDDSWLMRACGALLGALVAVLRMNSALGQQARDGFIERFWTTLRLPFCAPRVYVPTYAWSTITSSRHSDIIRHELVHVRDFAPWYGPFLMALLFVFPLPVLFSGRWFIERHAYLGDILAGEVTAAEAAEMLWEYYLWPWPRPWMQRWFEKQMELRP